MPASCLPAFLSILFIGMMAGAAWAHNPDTSYARVRISPTRLELRLTFDVVTLKLIVPNLDANRDRALSRAELGAAIAAARAYLTEHVFLDLEGKNVPLGVAGEPFWPLDASDPLPEEKWHETSALISFPFDTTLTSPPASVSLGFAVFDQLGDRHTVLGVFEAGGKPQEVVFNIAEPDYRLELKPAGAVAAAVPALPPKQRAPLWPWVASVGVAIVSGLTWLGLRRRDGKSGLSKE